MKKLLLTLLAAVTTLAPVRAVDTTLDTFQVLTGAGVDLAADKLYLWDTSAARAKGILWSEAMIALRITTSAGIATNVSDETGTGSIVLATSPTLVTPVLGAATGTSLVLSGNLTIGSSTNHLGAFAATTSAQLAGVISNETGSGLLVFATSPTLTTPSIGAATGTSLSLSGALTIGSSTNHLGAFAATTSAQLAGVVSDETGTGSIVLATSPTLVTPVLGAATGTSLSVSGAVTAGLLPTAAVAPAGITSSATIAPTARISFVGSTNVISTITPPTGIASTGGQITLIPTAAWTTNTAGNIAIASTAVAGKAMIFTYDAGIGLWYPSY